MLTVIVGVVRLFASGASIKIPDGSFVDDINESTWRMTIFSFAPDVFADVWTPFVMGILGFAAHFQAWEKRLVWQTATYMNYGLYHAAVALFGCMGYSGGLGIICSAASWIVVLLSLIIYFWDDESACLRLNSRFRRVEG
eukprot:GHVO01021865.1.p1 GENE.GHVO01021865.1~~GHVO01021865.1.p1  ORF type:complete len:140 (+),score=13.60 GHVO01021865.1:67-486(+)